MRCGPMNLSGGAAGWLHLADTPNLGDAPGPARTGLTRSPAI